MDVMSYVKRLYAGCGMESDMVELMSLLNDMVEAYHGGELDDAGLMDFATKLCTSIVTHMKACGKPYPMDKCVDDVVNVVKSSPPRGSFRALRDLLRRRRGRVGTTSTSVIP